ncbi:MAG: hypothetical protein IJQ55_00335, partial [Alphaproteobacteria bacterium]|nr:hypothetical protein [Alphaproteobacteria bacterium]
MVKSKKKWGELSIDKKFRVVFALQNFSLFLAWLFLDANFGFLVFLGFGILISSYVPENEWARDWTKTGYFTFSVLVLLFWLLENNMILRTDVDVDYNKLKSYSGVTIYNNQSKSAHVLRLGSDSKYETFECSIGGILLDVDDDCDEELRSYFGRGNTYDKNISVKHYKLYPTFNLIYEIMHNNKTIFSYDYFINKYHQQQKNAILFAIYLIANTLVFCIFYHLIQKNSVQHTQ